MGQTKKLRGHLKSPYAYYLMLPALLVYALLFVLPALSGLLLSFFNVKSFKLSTITFAGLEIAESLFQHCYQEYVTVCSGNDFRKSNLRNGISAAGESTFSWRELYENSFLPSGGTE